MYTDRNFKTKKELKAAVEAWNAHGVDLIDNPHAPRPVTYYQPGGVWDTPQNGTIYCEGPHYPAPHKWYAQCEARDGVIVKVK